MKRYIRKGVPLEHRARVWMGVSGAQARMDRNPGYYQRLLQGERSASLEEAIRTGDMAPGWGGPRGGAALGWGRLPQGTCVCTPTPGRDGDETCTVKGAPLIPIFSKDKQNGDLFDGRTVVRIGSENPWVGS